MSRKSSQHTVLYRMSFISSISNKYLRRMLMVLFTPLLFMVNITITFLITFGMWIFMLLTTGIRNNSILFKSLKEKW